MNDRSFFENNLICFVVAGSHILEKLLFVRFDETKKLSVFLKRKFGVVLEHDFFEVLLANYFGEGLSAENLACDFFLSPHSHFSNGVVIQGVKTKTFAFINFSLFYVSPDQRGDSLLNYVK